MTQASMVKALLVLLGEEKSMPATLNAPLLAESSTSKKGGRRSGSKTLKLAGGE